MYNEKWLYRELTLIEFASSLEKIMIDGYLRY